MAEIELLLYCKVRAVFQPKRLDDLKPGIRPFIGREGIFECIWLIDDNGDYHGDHAMMIPIEWMGDNTGVWVPSCDLELIALVKPGIDFAA
jgi:hypothetical protein